MIVGATPSTLRFAVLGELASGGMGRVDLARAMDRDLLIAVKRLHAHYAQDPSFIQMFLDEARLTGALEHPNLVALVGFGTDDEGLFLATELVRGAALSQLERVRRSFKEPLSQELVAYIGARVASGLAAAHALTGPDGASLNLVHRDVSLANVLCGIDGEVKLGDFGIAKARFASAHTESGVLKGKIHYLSPEYAAGETLDWRSDLFSLGIVLYQLASGVRPFDGEHEGQVMQKILNARPAPLAMCARHIHPELAAIIERLLSRDRALRAPHGTAGIARELDAWLRAHRHGEENLMRALGAYVERYGAAQLDKIDRLSDARFEATVVDAGDAPTLERSLKTEDRGLGTRVVARAKASPVLKVTLSMPISALHNVPSSRRTLAMRAAPVSTPPPPARRTVRTRILVFGGATLVSVSVLAALTVIHGAGTRAATPSKVSAVTPASEAPAPETSQPPPLPAPSQTADPPEPDPPPPATSTASASPAHSRPPPVRNRGGARRCTTIDFDYPACLKR